MTPAQRRALAAHWPRWGLDPGNGQLDYAAMLPGHDRRQLEIGFGMGESLLQMALRDRSTLYLGVEVHRPGVGRLLARVEAHGLTNVRVFCADALDVLRQCIPPASLDTVLLLFPDPWHKKRHHKRRLVQPDFVQLVASSLKPGGLFHLASDWEDYAAHMMTVMTAAPGFHNQHGPGSYCPAPPPRPTTKFENRGRGLGHGVWDLLFVRAAGGPC